MLATPLTFTAACGTVPMAPFCRACGQSPDGNPSAGDAPSPCPSCGADTSPPADERRSRVGRTFTYRAGLRTLTGVAVDDRGGVVVLLEAGRDRLVEIEARRLHDPDTGDPLAELISPAYRLAVAARSHPEAAGLLLPHSRELLQSTAARRAYAACALERGDDDALGGAGLAPAEVAWLRLWHHHRTGSPAGVLLAHLAALPAGGYPDKLAVIAAAWDRLDAEPQGRRLVAAHLEGCAGHPLAELLRAAGDDVDVDPDHVWPAGAAVPEAAAGLRFDPAATRRFAGVLAAAGPGEPDAGQEAARQALRQAREHLFDWEWEAAAATGATVEEALVQRGRVGGAGPGSPGAPAPAAGLVVEARNIAAAAAWQAGDPTGAARLLVEAQAVAPAWLLPGLLVNLSLVAAHAGDRPGAAHALGQLALEVESLPVRLDAARRALAVWYGGTGDRLAPAPAGRPPEAVVAALRTISASTGRAQTAALGLLECFEELMARLHRLGDGGGAGAAPMTPLAVAASSPWLILGLPFGTGSADARVAFTRRARRVRRTPEPGPFTLADLTWALHQVEHQGDDPWARLDHYRVPLQPPFRGTLRRAARAVIASAVPRGRHDPYADHQEGHSP